MTNIQLQLPSPYPLRWFRFCIYFRYFAGPVLLLLQTFGNYQILSTEDSFLFLLDSCAALFFIVLACNIVTEAGRFTKRGLRNIYVYLYLNTFWNIAWTVIELLANPYDAGLYVTQIIFFAIPILLELKYYSRRKPLFIYTKEENVRYYYDKKLAKQLKESQYDDEKQKIYNLIKENPALTADQIGAQLGISGFKVRNIMETLDME